MGAPNTERAGFDPVGDTLSIRPTREVLNLNGTVVSVLLTAPDCSASIIHNFVCEGDYWRDLGVVSEMVAENTHLLSKEDKGFFQVGGLEDWEPTSFGVIAVGNGNGSDVQADSRLDGLPNGGR